MKLIDNWQLIVRKAWSVKFSIISAFFSAGEFAVQMIQPAGIPGGAFAAMAGGVSLAAGIARLIAQQEISNASPASTDPQADSKG